MDKLNINSTFTTPEVNFDPKKGLLEIEGKIIPEDAEGFFTAIFKWIENYSPENNQSVVMRFRLFYYNTGSSKNILALMKKIDELFLKGNDIKIIWEYEEGDEDSMHDCEDYKKNLKVPIEIKKI
jgi:hypothetical protein